jgi:putative intracellular protease/amidase
LKSHRIILHENEQQQEREAPLQRKKKLPDDSYTISIFVDAYNFKGEGVYQGDGFSLQMMVNRTSLEAFADALAREYEEFKKQFSVDEWNAEND